MSNLDDLYRVIWMSRPLMQAAEALVEQGLRGTGLTVRTRAVLEILADAPDGLSVPAIAQRLEIQRQYVQIMANEALAAELIEKIANPSHKRSALMRLTAQGRRLIGDVMAHERATLAEFEGAFSAQDLRTTRAVTEALLERLKFAVGGSA